MHKLNTSFRSAQKENNKFIISVKHKSTMISKLIVKSKITCINLYWFAQSKIIHARRHRNKRIIRGKSKMVSFLNHPRTH